MNLFTYLFFDEIKPNIEKLLKCSVSRSNYTKKYIDYKIGGYLDDSRVEELEHVIKRKVNIIHSDFNFTVRVYNFYLGSECDFEYVTQKDSLILGYGYDGLVTIPINHETNNFILVGASGSGKSSLAQSIIANLKNNEVQTWISDNKGSHDYDFLNLRLTKDVYGFMKLLDEFEDEVERRLKQNISHKPLLYVIDEVFPISCTDNKIKTSIFNKLSLVLSRCRSANCHVMIISQRSTTDVIDPRLLANISNRICLMTASKQESVNVLSDDRAFRIDKIGRGILSINGHLSEFQSFYMKNRKVEFEVIPTPTPNLAGSELLYEVNG